MDDSTASSSFSSSLSADTSESSEVEMTTQISQSNLYFIDSTSKKQLIIIFVLLSLFILLHIVAAFRAPPIFADKIENFPVNTTNDNYSIEMDISLSKLVPLHRFVNVNCSLLRNEVKYSDTKDIELTAHLGFDQKNNSKNQAKLQEKHQYTIEFARGKEVSSGFPIFHRVINSEDSFSTVDIQASVFTNYTTISGFQFHWTFSNPSADKYCRASRLLLCVLIAYMTIVYSSFLTFDTEIFTEVFCLIMGVAGLFACNPFAFFLPESNTLKISDFVFQAVFIALLRMFLLMQHILVHQDVSTPSILLTVFTGLAFGFYATVDAAASFDRAQLISQLQAPEKITVPTEKFLGVLNTVYCLILASFVMLSLMKKGHQSRRNYFVSLISLLTTITTFITQVVMIFTGIGMTTVLPQVFFQSIHLTSTAFLLFMLRPSDGADYRQVEDDIQYSSSCGDAIEIDIDENAGSLVDD